MSLDDDNQVNATRRKHVEKIALQITQCSLHDSHHQGLCTMVHWVRKTTASTKSSNDSFPLVIPIPSTCLFPDDLPHIHIYFFIFIESDLFICIGFDVSLMWRNIIHIISSPDIVAASQRLPRWHDNERACGQFTECSRWPKKRQHVTYLENQRIGRPLSIVTWSLFKSLHPFFEKVFLLGLWTGRSMLSKMWIRSLPTALQSGNAKRPTLYIGSKTTTTCPMELLVLTFSNNCTAKILDNSTSACRQLYRRCLPTFLMAFARCGLLSFV